MATNHNFSSIPTFSLTSSPDNQRLLMSIKGNTHLLIDPQLTLGLKPSLEHTRGKLTYTCQSRGESRNGCVKLISRFTMVNSAVTCFQLSG